MFLEFVNGLLRLSTEYGDVCRMWFGTSLYVLVSGLEDIEAVSYTHLDVYKRQRNESRVRY